MNRQKMDYLQYDQRLAYLTELAYKGRLLSLSQISSRFDCSERTVKRMLSHLRNKGIPIYYSPILRKFIIDSARDK